MQCADRTSPDPPDQGLHCPLSKSMDIVVYVYKLGMTRSACMDAHYDLDRQSSQMTQGPFSHIAIHMIL